MRLIDADALWEKIYEHGGCGAAPDTWADGWDKAIFDALDCVEAAPTIIPARTARTGCWVHGEYHIAHCSECGYVPLQLTPFCGNCGADMREDDDDEIN